MTATLLRLTIAAALLFTAACGSALSAAGAYRDAGGHELATLYFALYQKAGEDPEARQALVASVENAARGLDAEFEERAQAGDHIGTLGTALRKADLLSHARSLGLGETAALSAAPEIDRAMKDTRRATVAALDAAADQNVADQEMLELLRVALAYSPNDAELAARYERKRAGLSRTLVTKTSCERTHQAACSALAGEVLARLTRERREITTLATPDSAHKDTQLTLELSSTASDTDWKRVVREKAKTKVKRRDRFKEVVLNKKGKPVYDEVKVSFEVFERSTRASVTARAVVTDLGPSGETLTTKSAQITKDDTRRYVQWTGDERAIPAKHRHGTDTSAPTSTDELTQHAITEAAEKIARELLAQLEGGAS